jgi:diacylglycerol kinase (ATP)
VTEQWTVLVNPRSGRKGALIDRVHLALTDLGLDANVEAPIGEAEMRTSVRTSIAAGRRHIAIVGGDGTISLVVDELMKLDLPTAPVVAVLPAGTGSDFARPFAIAQNIEGAIHHLVGQNDYPIDVGFVRGEWGTRAYVNVAQAGLLAASVEAAARLPGSMGRLKYQVAFWATLPRFTSTDIELVTDRRTYEGEALLALFANGQFFGGGFNVAPKAALMDGILDAQVIHAKRWEALQLFPMVKLGVHLHHPKVTRIRTATFSLKTAAPWPFEVDGDVIGRTPVTGWVEQNRLFLRL